MAPQPTKMTVKHTHTYQLAPHTHLFLTGSWSKRKSETAPPYCRIRIYRIFSKCCPRVTAYCTCANGECPSPGATALRLNCKVKKLLIVMKKATTKKLEYVIHHTCYYHHLHSIKSAKIFVIAIPPRPFDKFKSHWVRQVLILIPSLPFRTSLQQPPDHLYNEYIKW